MIYLIVVSALWGLSFGIIKYYLSGVNPYLVSFIRLLLSFLVFVPFFARIRKISIGAYANLISIGAIQFGLMYVLYIYSFKFLTANQIALFTVFTPIYVTIVASFFEKTFKARYFVAALLAVIGAFYIYYSEFYSQGFWKGFGLMQASNACFAFGQVAYAKYMKGKNLKDSEAMSLLYLGAIIVAAGFFFSDYSNIVASKLTRTNFAALIYLGIVASGICFFLWNKGARKVNYGVLAVMNNMKIPLGILFAFLIFGEAIDYQRAIIGGIIITLSLFLIYKR